MKGKIKIFGRCEHAYEILDQAESLTCDDCLEKIIKEIQQKPEIDDMEDYVEGKAGEIESMSRYPMSTFERMNIFKDFLNQIISDVQGEKMGVDEKMKELFDIVKETNVILKDLETLYDESHDVASSKGDK